MISGFDPRDALYLKKIMLWVDDIEYLYMEMVMVMMTVMENV